MSPHIVWVTHAVATWYMVGLIWMVQIVHYAMFDRVGSDQFVAYELDHNRLITPIVAVPMLIELVTAGWLLIDAPEGVPPWAVWAGLLAIGGIWLSTALLQVPYHACLSQGFDAEAHRLLVQTNWIRTVLWSGRGLLTGWLTVGLIGGR